MNKKNNEKIFIKKRIIKAKFQSILFYIFRIFPIKKNKIVFTTLEGTTGYICNPKYIAQEIIKQKKQYKLYWLVNDTSKKFPEEVVVIENTLINRAFHLTTAKVWIDNSRKQLEVRKRKNQIYIQTWHAKIGFKPTGFDRGFSFTKIAQIVTKHDSDMIDYLLSNCDMFDKIAPTGLLYTGKLLRTGSPRLDLLVHQTEEERKKSKTRYNLNPEDLIVLWAPTFRSGSQVGKRIIEKPNLSLDFDKIILSFEKKYEKKCHLFLRLHPQLTARKITTGINHKGVVDVSNIDDLYDIMMVCDAVITDYSSIAFDAGSVNIPVFLFCDDYDDYIKERGNLLWDMKTLPFPFAETNEDLCKAVQNFSFEEYKNKMDELKKSINMKEDGFASKRVVKILDKICYGDGCKNDD